jgi:hypothetical protein
MLLSLDLHKSLCNFLILYADFLFEINNNEIAFDSKNYLESEAAVEQNEYLGHKNRIKINRATVTPGNALEDNQIEQHNTNGCENTAVPVAGSISMENSTNSSGLFLKHFCCW